MKKLRVFLAEKTQVLNYSALVLLYIALNFSSTPSWPLLIISLLLLATPAVLVLVLPDITKEQKKNVIFLTLLVFLALLFYAGQHDFLWQGEKLDADSRERAEGIRLFLRLSFLLLMASAVLFAILFEVNKYRHESDRGVFIRNKIITVISLLVFLVSLNYAAGLRPFMIDLTLLRRFSLSPEGRELVKNIQTPIKITAFYPFFHDLHREMDLFLKDVTQTNPLISYSIHDALREREVAENAKVDRNGWLVLTAADPKTVALDPWSKARRLSFTTPEQMRQLESDVLAAMLAIVSPRKKVYFTVNHGETGSGTLMADEQISRFIEQLKKNNYEISYLTPQNNFPAQVPEDAAAVVILGATKNFSEAEKKALQQYKQKGGRFLLALKRDGADLGFLLQEHGVTFNNSPARSEVALKPRSNNLICEQYADHPLTRRLLTLPETERFSFFPDAGSFNLKQTADSFADFIVLSDSRSWSDNNRNNVHDRDKEPMGSLNIAVATGWQKDGKTQRSVVAFASPDFLQNRYLAYGQNLYLAIGALNWLLEDERVQGLVPYRSDEKPVRLSPTQENFIFYGFAIIYPLLLFAGGILWQRRYSRFKGDVP